ncbi:hypothetical protein PMAYCL1PPCAC_13099, partial [Pristionchus mayeri]
EHRSCSFSRCRSHDISAWLIPPSFLRLLSTISGTLMRRPSLALYRGTISDESPTSYQFRTFL